MMSTVFFQYFYESATATNLEVIGAQIDWKSMAIMHFPMLSSGRKHKLIVMPLRC